MKGCELCRLPAKICCEADGASLCWECDEKVHCANFLVAKHSRNLLCHVCQSPTPWRASGPKLGPTTTASVCDSCVHKYCHSSIYAKHENISGAQQSHPPPPLNENHDHNLHLHLHLQDGINHTTSTDHQYYEEYDDEDSEVEYGDHDDDEDEDDDDDQEMEEEGENQVVPLSSCSTPPPPLIPTSSSTSEDHLSSCISVRLNAHDPDYQDEVGSYSSRFNNSVSYVASEEEKANSLSSSRPLKIRRTNYEMIQAD